MKSAASANVRALIRLVVFICVFFAAFMAVDRLFFSGSNIHPTWEYAAQPGHDPIDILFVGNSHTYTSIDAELLTQATGLNVRELTCASVNGEIVAADLAAFLEYEVPKVVVLEMCPFGATNFEEMRNDKIGLVYEHFDGIPNPLWRLRILAGVASPKDIPAGLSQLFRGNMMWSRWTFDHGSRSTYDRYGAKRQYQVYYDYRFDSEAISAQYGKAMLEDPEGSMDPTNLEAFEEILELAEKHDFEIWIYNAPTATYDARYARPLSKIISMQGEYPRLRFIDNSMVALPEIGLERTDYYDAGHLNPNGMEKITVWMGKLIADRFQCEFKPDAQAAYKETTVRMLEDGNYRYTFDIFGEGERRFVYSVGDKRVDTGFTDQDWIDEAALTQWEIGRFWVYVRSTEAGAEERQYRFVPFTIEHYGASIKSSETIEIKNESNFSNELLFAWYVTNKETNEVEKYPYSNSNIFSYTFAESGTYLFRAYTRQQPEDYRRFTDILTVTYDAETGTLSVDEALDCVTVS